MKKSNIEYFTNKEKRNHNIESMKMRFLDAATAQGTPLRWWLRDDNDYYGVGYSDCDHNYYGVYYVDSKYTIEGLLFVLQHFYYIRNADDAYAWYLAVIEIINKGVNLDDLPDNHPFVNYRMRRDLEDILHIFCYYRFYLEEIPDRELAYCEYVSWFDIWRSIADIELYYRDEDSFNTKQSHTMNSFRKQYHIFEGELPRFHELKSESDLYSLKSFTLNREILECNEYGDLVFSEDYLLYLFQECKQLIYQLESQTSYMQDLLDRLTVSAYDKREFLYEKYKASLCHKNSIDTLQRFSEIALKCVVNDIVDENENKKLNSNSDLIAKLRSSLSDWLTIRTDIAAEIYAPIDTTGLHYIPYERKLKNRDFIVCYLRNTIKIYKLFCSALSRIGPRIELPYFEWPKIPRSNDMQDDEAATKKEEPNNPPTNSTKTSSSGFIPPDKLTAFLWSKDSGSIIDRKIEEERKRAKMRELGISPEEEDMKSKARLFAQMLSFRKKQSV